MNAQHSTPRADHHVEPHSDRDRHHPQHLDPQARPGRRWLRILLPALLILASLAVTGIGGPYFGKISEVTSESATDRLPATAQCQDRLVHSQRKALQPPIRQMGRGLRQRIG